MIAKRDDERDDARTNHFPLDREICSGTGCPAAVTCGRVRPDLDTPWRATQKRMAPPEDADDCTAYTYQEPR